MPADLLVVISWTWLFAGFCVCICLRISLIWYAFMQRTPAQHLDNTVSQLCPVQRQLSVFRQFGRSPECWNGLNMRTCYYNWFITTGLSCHASFMGQQHTEQKLPSYHASESRWTQTLSSGSNLAFSILTPQWTSCLYLFIPAVWLLFTRLIANSSCQCVIIFEKQGRPINTV